VSSAIGIAAGAVQGLFRRLDRLAVPARHRNLDLGALALSVADHLVVLVPGFFVLLGILLLFSWVSLVGLVRAEFLRGRNFEYIMAARALGVSNAKIMFRHLLPNAMVATLTFLPVHPVVVGDDR
jgi:microcin C transport system permease protein